MCRTTGLSVWCWKTPLCGLGDFKFNRDSTASYGPSEPACLSSSCIPRNYRVCP